MKRGVIIFASIVCFFIPVTLSGQQRTRIEKDLLGEKEIPVDAYYGVQTARALENFQISGIQINHYPGFVEAWAFVKLAAARANTDDLRSGSADAATLCASVALSLHRRADFPVQTAYSGAGSDDAGPRGGAQSFALISLG